MTLEPDLVAAPQTLPSLGYGTLPIRRILVVQTQRLGDALCATPLFTAIRQQFPLAHITAMVQPGVDQLLRGGPDLNDIMVYDRRAARHSPVQLLRLIGELKERQFDWSLTIHAAGSVAFALWQASISWRTCIWRYADHRKPHWAWTYHQHIRQDRQHSGRHEVESNLDALRELGFEPRVNGYRIYISRQEREETREWLRDRGRQEERPLAVIHPGHGGGRQVWAPGRYARVAEGLLARGFQVALTGSSAEERLVRSIAGQVSGPVLALAGGMDLRRLAAVLGEARIFTSIATGPMHLAAAMGVPVVTLYGPTDLRCDLQRFYAYGTRSLPVVSPVPCNCPSSHTCQEPICMKGIEVDAVLEAAERLWRDSPASAGRE